MKRNSIESRQGNFVARGSFLRCAPGFPFFRWSVFEAKKVVNVWKVSAKFFEIDGESTSFWAVAVAAVVVTSGEFTLATCPAVGIVTGFAA